MRQPKSIKITIPEPCHENWEAMSPNEKGRHCDKCAKTVVDFTAMSDSTIIQYLQNNKNACGRFYNHQLNRDIPVYTHQNAFVKFLRKGALASVLLSYFLPKKMMAQDTVNRMVGDTIIQEQPSTQIFIHQPNIVVKGNLYQPDSAILKVVKLKFTVDTFSMEIDMRTTDTYNFTVPGKYSNDSMKIELFTADTNYVFQDVGIEKFGYRQEYFSNSRSLNFMCSNNIWNYSIAMNPIFPEITYGGLPWITEWDKPWDMDIKPIDFKNITVVQTLGWTQSTGEDSLLKKKDDSTFYAKLKRDKAVYLSKKKNKKSHWAWWLTVPVVVAAMVLRRMRNKKKLADSIPPDNN